MCDLIFVAINIKHEEAIGCIDSGVPELVEWGKMVLGRKYVKKEVGGGRR